MTLSRATLCAARVRLALSLGASVCASAACGARQTAVSPESHGAEAPAAVAARDSNQAKAPLLAHPVEAVAAEVPAAVPVATVPAVAPAAEPLPVVQLPPELVHVSFAGGNGRDCDHPARIVGAKNPEESGAAEKVWLRAVYPGLRPYEHALTKRDGRMLDAYSLKKPDGELVYACFDINETFGNW